MLCGAAILTVKHTDFLTVLLLSHLLEIRIEFQLFKAAFPKLNGFLVPTICAIYQLRTGFIIKFSTTVDTCFFQLYFLNGWFQMAIKGIRSF